MSDPGNSRRLLQLSLLLGLVTLALYARVTRHEFIIYDDPDYLTKNTMVQQGLTPTSVAWAFTSTEYSNWFPLTWLSHELDWQLFGRRPGAHHAMNLFFHTLATLLLFHALRRMTGTLWRSAFVAAMFAWHPAHVESVAWASERKDVLSAVFWMLTLLAYQRYVERPGARRYALALFTFALGLMSKPMLVTLPFVLLLLDFWPLHRLSLPAGIKSGSKPGTTPNAWTETFRAARRLTIEKIPFFALSLASSVVTYLVQKAGGAMVMADRLSLGPRLINALVAYLDYVWKIIWPANLAVLYPYQLTKPLWKIALAAALLGGLSALAVRWIRSRPWFLVGWFWFLGTLVPTIGLVQVGLQAMADRYTYIPAIGLGLVLAWGAGALVTNWPQLRLMVQTAGVGALAAWLVLTWQQIAYWQNSRTLLEHTLAATGGSPIILEMLGDALVKEGGALIREEPPRFAGAEKLVRRAIEVRPDWAGAYHNLGVVLSMEKNYDEAIVQFQKALALDPKSFDTHNSLALVLVNKRQFDQALYHFGEDIRLNPDSVESWVARASLLHELGRLDEAIADCRQALKLKPNHATALFYLGNALFYTGRSREAVEVFRRFLALNPQSVDILNRLAWVLATTEDSTLRNGAEAVQLATRACELSKFQNSESLNTLAAAYAETGRFDEAVQTAQRAIVVAQAAGQTGFVAAIQALVQDYQAKKPHREPMRR